MKSKTVLTQIRETIDEQIAYYTDRGADLKLITELEDIDKLLKSYLDEEKLQIIEACVEFSNHGEEMSLERAEQYYRNTYENN